MSWKYYNIFYISSKSSNLYPNNANQLHLLFLDDQKKDAIVVLASFFSMYLFAIIVFLFKMYADYATVNPSLSFAHLMYVFFAFFGT